MNITELETIQVTAAILRDENRFLLCQRPYRRGHHLSGLWEFPGGKVETGESHQEALARELREELSIEAWGFRYFTTSQTRQPGGLIELHCYFVDGFSGSIRFTEHRCGLWLFPEALVRLPLAPGDVEPVRLLQKGSDIKV